MGSVRPRRHERMHKLKNFMKLLNIICYSNSEGTILIEIINTIRNIDSARNWYFHTFRMNGVTHTPMAIPHIC
jgi:hypothetical protein